MVDSIRRTHRIGVIQPTGQRRAVERRQPSPEERQHQRGDDGQGSEEESAAVHTEKQTCTKPDEDANKPSGHGDTPSTGRCIDVRI